MFQYQMRQKLEVWVSMLVCIWGTFSCVSGRKGCLAEFLFLFREDFQCLIKETNKRYILRFTQHKVYSNVNDKVVSDFIKKDKTLYLGGLVFGRSRKCISTLAFNPNLGRGVSIALCGNFSLCENHFVQLSYCLYLQKRLETF